MRRSVLTGFLLVTLSASSFAIARADDTAPATGAVPGATASAASTALNAAAYPAAANGAGSPESASGAGGTAAASTAGSPATTTASSSAAPAAANAASSADAAAGSADTREPGDASLPTAGSDLTMWNASSALDEQTAHVRIKAPSRLQRFASGIVSRSTAIASSLTRSALRFIGVPYVFGGTHASGFDCSGYVQHVFAMLGFHLPRTADAQFDAGHRIATVMAPGDLVFFHTYAPGVSHVGIYIGNDKFVHSSSSHGVSIASLHDSYWAPRYLGAKRVLRF